MMDLLGWGELILIFVIALIVIGPHDLPKVLYTLGRWVQSLKKIADSFKMELEGLSRLEKLHTIQKDIEEDSLPQKDASLKE